MCQLPHDHMITVKLIFFAAFLGLQNLSYHQDLPDKRIDMSLNVLTIFLWTIEIYSSPDSF